MSFHKTALSGTLGNTKALFMAGFTLSVALSGCGKKAETLESESDNLLWTQSTAQTVISEDASYVHSGSQAGIDWTLTDTGVLTLSGRMEDLPEWNWGLAEWAKYRDEVSIAYVQITGAKSLDSMFSDYVNLKEVELSGLDTSQTSNMNFMSQKCESLTTLNLTNSTV